MTLGLFVNKNHVNYISFIAFLTSQVIEHNNIVINVFNDYDKISNFNFSDINILLNRYCFIRLNKIFNSKKSFGQIKTSPLNEIVVFPKDITINKNISFKSFIEEISLYQHEFLHKECYMPNIGYVNCKPSDSTFLCYNDTNEYFINFLKEHLYKRKDIFYNNKVYTIDPNKYFFKYKNQDACLLYNNLIVWDSSTQEWKKIKKGAKIC